MLHDTAALLFCDENILGILVFLDLAAICGNYGFFGLPYVIEHICPLFHRYSHKVILPSAYTIRMIA